jgi:hypothetical protein
MPYYFRVCPDVEIFFEESKPLFAANKEETNLFDTKPLDYNQEAYREMFNNGSYIMFEFRRYDEKGSELVGYAGFFLYYHLHHKTSLIAKQDLIFIRKDYRRTSMSFIRFCDNTLKELGIHEVMHSSPAINDWGIVLERLGYKKLETIYTRSL